MKCYKSALACIVILMLQIFLCYCVNHNKRLWRNLNIDHLLPRCFILYLIVPLCGFIHLEKWWEFCISLLVLKIILGSVDKINLGKDSSNIYFAKASLWVKFIKWMTTISLMCGYLSVYLAQYRLLNKQSREWDKTEACLGYN